MYLLENPVLQRELLVNLRMRRAFVLLFLYVGLLGLVVFAAWPSDTKLDLVAGAQQSLQPQAHVAPPPGKRLVNLFFLGQYILMAMMAPSFAAGAIAGEKERKTYEMLLASPLRPTAIVLGKLLAALSHLAVLVFASLPIVMLCLPLGGGISLWEVLATYVAMAASVVTFGMISLAASSYFSRTIGSLLVSYMMILPLALLGVLFYSAFEQAAVFRLFLLSVMFPGACLAVCAVLLKTTSARLMHPPDVGSDAREVVDVETEQREAVGMVIRSDQFPDRLFAPPKRVDLLPDGANPVYDKEMRSELFSQGTLMLRLVIQSSMGLALPLMAVFLYVKPELAPWYVGYVLLFNILVGPVFSAGSVTSERERQTLELLLTTTISPWQILWAKLYSSLRISCVLTSFLIWPLLLAYVLPGWTYLHDTTTMVVYVAIIAVASLTTTTLAMFCSVICRKTTTSMIAAYLIVIGLFIAPIAVKVFADTFTPARAAFVHHEPTGQIAEAAEFWLVGPKDPTSRIAVEPGVSLEELAGAINTESRDTGVAAVVKGRDLLILREGPDASLPVGFHLLSGTFETRVPATIQFRRALFVSPFAAAMSLPLTLGTDKVAHTGETWWPGTAAAFLAFYLALDGLLVWVMIALFKVRWRVAQ